MKKCSKCGKDKSYSNFYKEKRAKDGLRSACKQCLNICSKNYVQKNKQKIKKYCSEYYKENRNHLKSNRRSYYKANKQTVNKVHASYIRQRRSNDPLFKLMGNIRGGIYKCIKGLSKSSKSIDYIGCDINLLKKHLESLFQEGMTFENYGLWHVDHIRPLNSFKFCEEDLESQLKEAWHYSNLQPLWAKDNLTKGSQFQHSPKP